MDIEVVKKLIENTAANHSKFMECAKEGNAYYKNKSGVVSKGANAIDIFNRFLTDIKVNPLKSADNRIPVNYHEVFVDQKIGYMFTYPPQFDVGDESVNSKIKDFLGDDYEKVIKQLGIDCSNTGKGYIHYWLNEEKKLDYYFVDPLQIWTVRDSSKLKPKNKYVIRAYQITDEKGEIFDCYELWDKDEMHLYKKPSNKNYDELNPVYIEHDGSQIEAVYINPFGEVPFIEFKNKSTGLNDLSMYKDLIDAYERIISGFVNDIDDIQEIIWVIKNYTGPENDVVYDKEGNPIEKPFDLLQELKAKKLIRVNESGGVEAIRGEVPTEARKVLLEIIQKLLPISAMGVDPIPDNTGNSSGVYIDFLYNLLELKAGLMETEFKSSLNQLIRVVCNFYKLSCNKIEQTWTRNKPRNEVETANIINSTPSDIVSNKTKTKNHPLVDNYQNELKEIKKEAEKVQKNLLEVPMFKMESNPPIGDEDVEE
ncbi:MAG: phage portal protein [Anaerorhabdus sp.]|uniref:phage portal protein n=1 Tax=Anaerorhabdus sp. TaxID=1872524 RepID=UPI003A8BB154